MKATLLKLKPGTLAIGLTLAVCANAFAAGCPSGKEGNNALPGAPTAPAGVTDTELAAIDLSKENVKLSERRLRLRKMTIAPDGIVPLHSHADRPALIRVDSGEIVENNSKCTVPILHKAGDIAKEFLGTRHWWKNDSGKPVELTITDIVNDKKADPMKDMM
ncbi:cupin [Actimicrobium sp. CCI2.3]|uniref:cupin domain-containing protein n=1 Tax=Actimicrobium sp. CCI2.3 TaxID=3048616 RepID=UPI002AB58161|nr:cupin [Actimicrobium sp. CCI2.3]MDY7574624.1 cupin [Actimicrobium sp. CCI2.3]MEB0023983.1 cupin [Actimicrobium sp. CCI2.3]